MEDVSRNEEKISKQKHPTIPLEQNVKREEEKS